MGKDDQVTHISAPVTDERKIQELGSIEKEARDYIHKAMHLLKPFLGKPAGFAGVFFYQIDSDNAEVKSFISLESIPNRICQAGTAELIKACMRAYGVTPPKDAKKLHA
jgi:hypothetical protein